MSDAPSSLFPCVIKSSEEENLTQAPVSWLQNSSFPQHLVAAANQVDSRQSGSSSDAHLRRDSKRHKREQEGTKDHHKKKKKKKDKDKDKDKAKDKKSLETELFQLLYKGDKDNYKYGSLYSYNVPSYKAVVQCCLGAPPNSQIMRKPKKVGSVTHDPSRRYYSKLSPVELTLQYRTKFLRLDADFISLTVSSQCWEKTEEALSVMDPSSSDPHNQQAWIQFINSTGKTKAGLERRYDICQKARKHLSNNLEILYKTIETAQQFMSNDQIGRVWTDILFHHPNKVELWLEYLKYKETNLTELNSIAVMSAYKKCFSTLFGFQQGTFRSHTFVGDIEDALIKVAAKFVSFLYNMGYTEKALSYNVALLEVSTSRHSKDEYLARWTRGCALLGSHNYADWWNDTVTSHDPDITSRDCEHITKVDIGEDVWLAWLREERRKEELCTGPIFRGITEDVIDPECSVTSSWLRQFLFVSSKPEVLLEAMFRVYLPSHLLHVPLITLLKCNISLPNTSISFLTRLCKQLYPRYSNQTTIGIIWILLNKFDHGSDKKTAGFIKGLLKDPNHRNNIVYWLLYTSFSDNNTVLTKLLSTPLSSYHHLVLSNRQTTEQTASSARFNSWDKEIEELLCKSQTSTDETLYLGSNVSNIFCKCYRARLSAGELYDTYLVEHISKILNQHSSQHSSSQQLADLFLLFECVISYELKCPSGISSNRLKKIALLAVEQFPAVDKYWDLLAAHTTLTNKLWDRLLKVDEEVLWYRRITVECEKQEENQDINLTHRIISLSVSAIDSFPKSKLLWGQYIQNTKKYDKNSLKSILIRSIKENPSYKEFYLQGIDSCVGEAESLYELIEEKQVRLRTLIEEVYMFTLGL